MTTASAVKARLPSLWLRHVISWDDVGSHSFTYHGFDEGGSFRADRPTYPQTSATTVLFRSRRHSPYDAFSMFAPLINSPSVVRRDAPTRKLEYLEYANSVASVVV